MWKRLAGVALLMMAVIQVVPAPYRIGPGGNDANQSIEADRSVPEQVRKILRRSCMDCHSELTRVPWYGHVAPVSWLLARDVEKGRAAMNLSRWGMQEPSMRMALAAIACEDVRSGRMPPSTYLVMHGEATLSRHDVDAVCKWSEDLMSMARLRRKR
jgi:hypothetical protein